ncbi:hypothetical protein CDD82_336 [Ophiocordyceps australis]|uniref:Rhodopsin domain-containing protein n=1 Tax=Ophiocordyceps australis TaxID=1399860 RepID=A0A2C5YN24_9HYPO|nr:hypothetical protein CDD82_336 [Ophiocordyceps australis]
MAETALVRFAAAAEARLGRPQNQNTIGYWVNGLALGIATVVTVLRLYSRWFVVGKRSFGDYVLIAAYILLVGDVAAVFELMRSIGILVHQDDLSAQEIHKFLQIAFYATMVFAAFIVTAKATVLLEWIRIFIPPHTRNSLFWACHLVMWTNVVFYLVVTICICILCTPLEDKWSKHDTCKLDAGWISFSSAGVNLATDICIFLLPQRVIWRLQMTTRRKFGVAAIFSIGILGAAAAAVRLGLAIYSVRSPRTDSTYGFSSITLCTTAEGVCAFIVVCGPALPQAFSHTSATKLRSSAHRCLAFVSHRLQQLRFRKHGEAICNVELSKKNSVIVGRCTFDAVVDCESQLGEQHHEPPLSKNRPSRVI